jgi:hypothetical protein
MEYLHTLAALDASGNRIALKWRFIRSQMPATAET